MDITQKKIKTTKGALSEVLSRAPRTRWCIHCKCGQLFVQPASMAATKCEFNRTWLTKNVCSSTRTWVTVTKATVMIKWKLLLKALGIRSQRGYFIHEISWNHLGEELRCTLTMCTSMRACVQNMSGRIWLCKGCIFLKDSARLRTLKDCRSWNLCDEHKEGRS